MSTQECYADAYETRFSDEATMLGFIREREVASEWNTIPTNMVEFQAVERDTTIEQVMRQSYESIGQTGVLEDTIKNTALFLNTGSKLYPVRRCAIASILSRARISGNALSKVKKAELAQILNYCVNVAGGKSLLRVADEKVSAMHGGDESEYAVLSMPELFHLVTEALSRDFTGYRFVGGHFDHSMATAVWSFEDNDDLTGIYRDALDKHGIASETMTPAVRFTTSDTGTSGANLYPMLLSGACKHSIMLGSPLKLEHKHGATLDKFQELLDMLYTQYQTAIEQVTKLLDIDVSYPRQAMLRVMKKIGIPKKLAFQTLDLFLGQHGEEACTAYEVYLGICEAVFLQESGGATGSRIAQMEENISRALKVRWGEYDYPGEDKW